MALRDEGQGGPRAGQREGDKEQEAVPESKVFRGFQTTRSLSGPTKCSERRPRRRSLSWRIRLHGTSKEVPPSPFSGPANQSWSTRSPRPRAAWSALPCVIVRKRVGCWAARVSPAYGKPLSLRRPITGLGDSPFPSVPVICWKVSQDSRRTVVPRVIVYRSRSVQIKIRRGKDRIQRSPGKRPA